MKAELINTDGVAREDIKTLVASFNALSNCELRIVTSPEIKSAFLFQLDKVKALSHRARVAIINLFEISFSNKAVYIGQIQNDSTFVYKKSYRWDYPGVAYQVWGIKRVDDLSVGIVLRPREEIDPGFIDKLVERLLTTKLSYKTNNDFIDEHYFIETTDPDFASAFFSDQLINTISEVTDLNLAIQDGYVVAGFFSKMDALQTNILASIFNSNSMRHL